MIDAHAFFDIPFNHPITNEELQEWEISRRDPLSWVVSFYWCFDLDGGSDCCHLEDWRKLEFWINE
jgi:hypothetical protein